MEGLATCRPEELEALADELLADAPAEVVAGPEAAVAPLRLPGSEGTGTVVVARVAVTRCSVRLAGTPGDAIIPGRAPRAALAAALLDAEAERRGSRTGAVEALALAALERRARALAAEAAGVAATRTDGDE